MEDVSDKHSNAEGYTGNSVSWDKLIALCLCVPSGLINQECSNLLSRLSIASVTRSII